VELGRQAYSTENLAELSVVGAATFYISNDVVFMEADQGTGSSASVGLVFRPVTVEQLLAAAVVKKK
jgi:hypothetical protein